MTMKLLVIMRLLQRLIGFVGSFIRLLLLSLNFIIACLLILVIFHLLVRIRFSFTLIQVFNLFG